MRYIFLKITFFINGSKLILNFFSSNYFLDWKTSKPNNLHFSLFNIIQSSPSPPVTSMIVIIEENHGESEDASDNISIVQIAEIFFYSFWGYKSRTNGWLVQRLHQRCFLTNKMVFFIFRVFLLLWKQIIFTKNGKW